METTTIKEELTSDQSAEWKEAPGIEYRSLLENDMWELVDLPPG